MVEDASIDFYALSVCAQGIFYEVKKMKTTNIKKMVLLAMLAAIAYMLAAVVPNIPILPAAPFLTYEPNDVVLTIGGFLMGPLASLGIVVVVAFLEMITVSETGIIGCVMNLISSASFSCIAALVYKKKRDIGGAVWGLLLGSVSMVFVMLLWNWLISPLYMGVSRSDVATMLVPVFLPFNALKAGFNSALTLILYKPLVTALRRTGLIPKQSTSHGVKWGIYVLGAGLLATCVLLYLILQGII